jgi:allantoin racemase
MTATIVDVARADAPADVSIDALEPSRGPASVEGRFDEVISAYWSMEAVLPIADQYDGLIVACYGPHPLIGALREALAQPVVGIMEASILHALVLGECFSIVTTSDRWRPLLQEGLRVLSVEARCASVRSTGLAVLDLETLPAELVRERLCAAAYEAIEQDGAEVICLGCAGMAGLDGAISQATGVPVVDGVRAAVAMLTGLVRTGVRTSKRRLYRPIDERSVAGLPPALTSAYAGNSLHR